MSKESEVKLAITQALISMNDSIFSVTELIQRIGAPRNQVHVQLSRLLNSGAIELIEVGFGQKSTTYKIVDREMLVNYIIGIRSVKNPERMRASITFPKERVNNLSEVIDTIRAVQTYTGSPVARITLVEDIDRTIYTLKLARNRLNTAFTKKKAQQTIWSKGNEEFYKFYKTVCSLLDLEVELTEERLPLPPIENPLYS